jgi:hypothetical protein
MTNEATPEIPMGMEFPYLDGEQLARVCAAEAAVDILQAPPDLTEFKVVNQIGSLGTQITRNAESNAGNPEVADIVALASWIMDGLDPWEKVEATNVAWSPADSFAEVPSESEAKDEPPEALQGDGQEPSAGEDFSKALATAFANAFGLPAEDVQVIRLDGPPCGDADCLDPACIEAESKAYRAKVDALRSEGSCAPGAVCGSVYHACVEMRRITDDWNARQKHRSDLRAKAVPNAPRPVKDTPQA